MRNLRHLIFPFLCIVCLQGCASFSLPENYSRFATELNFSHYYPLDLKVSHVAIKNVALEKNWNQNKGFFVEIPEKVLESYARSRFQGEVQQKQSKSSYSEKTLYVVIDNVALNSVDNNAEGRWSFLKEWLPIQRQENYEFLVTIGFYVLEDWQLKSTPVVQADTITLRRVMHLHESMTLEQREAMQRSFLHNFIEDLDLYIQEALRGKLGIL